VPRDIAIFALAINVPRLCHIHDVIIRGSLTSPSSAIGSVEERRRSRVTPCSISFLRSTSKDRLALMIKNDPSCFGTPANGGPARAARTYRIHGISSPRPAGE